MTGTLKTRLMVQSLRGKDLQLLPQGCLQTGTKTFNRSNPLFYPATHGYDKGTNFEIDQFYQADPVIKFFSFLPIPPTQNFVR